MWDILKARLLQGHRTMTYPDGPPPELPELFQGLPVLPVEGPGEAVDYDTLCPTQAITREAGGLRLDLGRCLFCGACRSPEGQTGIRFSRNHQLAATQREDLVLTPIHPGPPVVAPDAIPTLLRRSLKLREVSAGGCNACEADTNVLNTLAWDLGRFGVQFVASPRHADGLLITGPVTMNMREALLKTYDAVPAPKIVIAVGACAISGGPYRDHPEVRNGADSLLPVDLYIPGCPPHPLTILDGLLRLIGKL